MSRNTAIYGSIVPDRDLLDEEADVFDAVITHAEVHLSAIRWGNGVLDLASDQMRDYGLHPLEVSRSERYKQRTYDFAEFIAYLVSRPELEDILFTGEFELVTEQDPFPRIQKIIVEDSVVTRKVADIVFPNAGDTVTV